MKISSVTRYLSLPFVILLVFSSITVYGQVNTTGQEPEPVRIDSVKKSIQKAPVVPFNDTIFFIYTKLGPYYPKERASNIEQKIKKLSDDFSFHPDSLMIIPDENSTDIAFRETIIMTITAADVRHFNQTQEKIARDYRDAIVESIKQHRKESSLSTLLMQIGLVMLIIVIFYFSVKYINRFFRFVTRKITGLKGTRIKGINIKSYNILDEEKSTKFLVFITKIIKYICLILLFYLSLPLIFSIFPATQDLAEKLFGYVVNPLIKIFKKLIHYIPDLISIIVIVLVFRYLIKGIYYFAGEIEKGKLVIKGFYQDWAMPTFTIIKVLLYAFMFIIIFPYLPGSNSKVFQGVSVFIGVIFSLGSTSVISNIVAGLVLTYMRPFKEGDHIRIGEIMGTVMEKTPFVTRVRTHKNEEITIPNSNVLSAHTVNYTTSSKSEGLIIHTSVTIGYDVPWRKVHELLVEAAQRTPHLMKTSQPYVLQTALNDFYVEYQINAYTREDIFMAEIYSELHQNIQDTFNEAGVEIMSPHYRAQRDGNQTTIPENYLPEDYTAPPFRVKNTES